MLEVSRPYVVAGVALLLAQMIVIVGLLAERAWRRRTEREAQRPPEDLARLTDVSTIGELAASLAHELNQPLTGILCNARAAMHLLATPNPPLPEMRQILQDIVDDDKRAGEVIGRIRDVAKQRDTKRAEVDVKEVFNAH